MKIIIAIALLINILQADKLAEDKRLLINLNELAFCSAIYYVRTSTHNLKASEFFTGANVIMRQIAGYYYKEINQKNARNKDINKLVDIYLDMLEDEHKKNGKISNTIYKKISKCDGVLMFYINNVDQIDQTLLNPKIDLRSYLLTNLNFMDKKPLPINEFELEMNFNQWAVNNYTTATKIINNLHKDLKDKGILKK